MPCDITVRLSYTAPHPCALLLQIETVADTAQTILSQRLHIADTPVLNRIAGDSGIGQRIWLQVGETFVCDYDVTVDVQRDVVDLTTLARTPMVDLPGDVTPYLMASRYCHPEQFYDFVGGDLGHLVGGAFIQAASDWINASFTYDSFVSHAGTTAYDSYTARRGVCRDYAHVLIAMARARAIPARIVSCYAPNVTPQDFHAVAEVYLDGKWHLIDPTGMATPQTIVRIGVGRDAADVSFMTSYGLMQLKNQSVQVVSA